LSFDLSFTLPQSERYDEGTSVKVEQCDDSKEESKNNSDNSDGEQMFPDTNITLQHHTYSKIILIICIN
jgi:hypothetical protein